MSHEPIMGGIEHGPMSDASEYILKSAELCDLL